MSREEIISNLVNAVYRFAKTMPNNPHYYTLRDTWESQEAFNKTVIFIREYGVIEYYYRKPYICFYHGSYKYWTMGNSIERTKLINRAEA